jgi:hypothetical protein
MAYANSAVITRDLHSIAKTETSASQIKASRGFFRRLLEALAASRMRQAEREIARYLATRTFSDEVERDMERRFRSLPPYR